MGIVIVIILFIFAVRNVHTQVVLLHSFCRVPPPKGLLASKSHPSVFCLWFVSIFLYMLEDIFLTVILIRYDLH